jgi:hypothetical protein
MNELGQSLVAYWTLCRRVPTFNADDRELYSAYLRGDVQAFNQRVCELVWLLTCRALEPLFAAAYGDPHMYWDFDACELRDVWEPVLRASFGETELSPNKKRLM